MQQKSAVPPQISRACTHCYVIELLCRDPRTSPRKGLEADHLMFASPCTTLSLVYFCAKQKQRDEHNCVRDGFESAVAYFHAYLRLCWDGPCVFQIDPNSIAAKDGRIREGDRIIQVSPLPNNGLIRGLSLKSKLVLMIGLGLKFQKRLKNRDHKHRCVVRPDKLN